MYRLLHISVAVAFAQQLQQDLVALKEKRLGDISLAAKWAPTPGSKLASFSLCTVNLIYPVYLHHVRLLLVMNSICPAKTVLWCTCAESHDKDTFIASSAAELLFPAGLHQKVTESRAAYIVRVRELYRKTVLVPLRKCLDVPEVCKFTPALTRLKACAMRLHVTRCV